MSANDKGDPPGVLDLLWRCDLCGHQSWMATHPGRCDGCGTLKAPMTGRTMVAWRSSPRVYTSPLQLMARKWSNMSDDDKKPTTTAEEVLDEEQGVPEHLSGEPDLD